MAESIALNCDCMEYMKTLPDNAIDLAVVDPPYGDALANESGGRTGADSEADSTSTRRIDHLHSSCRARERDAERDTDKERTAASRTEHGVMRTGGTWATKYAKKSFRGT